MIDKDFESATVDGINVQTVNGNCWWCEDAEPTEPTQVRVGALRMGVGVCEDCYEQMQEDFN